VASFQGRQGGQMSLYQIGCLNNIYLSVIFLIFRKYNIVLSLENYCHDNKINIYRFMACGGKYILSDDTNTNYSIL